MDKELRREIIKKLNRAKKIDLESRKLKNELQSMIGQYFEEYDDDVYSNKVEDTIYDFTENGEYGADAVVDVYCSGSEFMKRLEKYFKENGSLK